MDKMQNQLSFSEIDVQPELEQFHLVEMQLFNWGTFSGIHTFQVSEDGLLVVGGSGSGKSTLFDAYSSLHTPVNWRSYNAASNNDNKGKLKARNDVSYLRGSWRKTENEDGVSAKNYLRTASTFSAIKASYKNNLGKTVTLIQILYIKGTSCEQQKIKKHWYIASIEFNLKILDGFEYDFKLLDEKLDQKYFKSMTSFSQFEEHYMARLGIENRLALRLLHKAQSAKNINNVNEFIRDYMLDETNTRRFASDLVDEYSSLEDAYKRVLDLKEQVTSLEEIRLLYQDHIKNQSESEIINYRLENLDQYTNQLKLGLYESLRDDLIVDITTLDGEISSLKIQIQGLNDHYFSLKSEWNEKGGNAIDDYVKIIETENIELDIRSKNKKQLQTLFKNIKEDFPKTERSFNDAILNIKNKLTNFNIFEKELTSDRDKNILEYSKINSKRKSLTNDISLLEQQQSRVTGRTARIRHDIAQALNLPLEDLPFVAELIQVKQEYRQWTGAIERVLYGFGLSILVQDKNYSAINDYINNNHLGGKIVYYKIDNNCSDSNYLTNPNSLISMIDVKETVFDNWILSRLERQFNYQCVKSILEFNQTKSMAVTINGLIKGKGNRHEKNDLKRIDDQQNWILGYNNKDLIIHIRKRETEINEELGSLRSAILIIEEKQKNNANIKVAYTHLSQQKWSMINEAEQVILLGKLKIKLNELRHNNNHIKTLEKQIQKCESDIENIETLKEEKHTTLVLKNNDLSTVKINITEIKENSQEIQKNIFQELNEEFNFENEMLNLVMVEKKSKGLRGRYEKILKENGLSDVSIKGDMIHAMNGFKERWKGESNNLVSSIEGVIDFISYLDEIEYDGLIRHENNFRQLLNQQAVTRLTNLDSEMKEAYQNIEERMSDVNEALNNVEYNKGTNLQIFTKKLDLEPVKEFNKMVQEILSFATTTDFESSQKRFLKINELQVKLRSEETVDKKWVEIALDVRKHYDFIAKELDKTKDRNVIDILGDDAQDSGGQKEKLAATILASALRYQLGGSDNHLPIFTTILLDEAFLRTDLEFTKDTMEIFKTMGFQMIIATPLKSIQVLEPYIGGAIYISIEDRKKSGITPIKIFYDNQHDIKVMNSTTEELIDIPEEDE